MASELPVCQMCSVAGIEINGKIVCSCCGCILQNCCGD
jgi:hypothetical protein